MSAVPKKKELAWEPCESLSSFLTLHAIVLKTAMAKMAKQTSPWSRSMKIPSWIFGGSTNSRDAHKRFNPKQFEWMWFKNARNATQCHGYRVIWIQLDSIGFNWSSTQFGFYGFSPFECRPRVQRNIQTFGGDPGGAVVGPMLWSGDLVLKCVEQCWKMWKIPVLKLHNLKSVVQYHFVKNSWNMLKDGWKLSRTQHDTTWHNCTIWCCECHDRSRDLAGSFFWCFLGAASWTNLDEHGVARSSTMRKSWRKKLEKGWERLEKVVPHW